ncbi:MAG: hypothetical protein ACJAR1_002551 [Rubritalea sp.]|jgi:hypothetical protein
MKSAGRYAVKNGFALISTMMIMMLLMLISSTSKRTTSAGSSLAEATNLK